MTGALTLLGLGTMGCRPSETTQGVDLAVVVLDQSASTRALRRCSELSARMRMLVPRVGEPTKQLLVLGTGGAASAGEPRTLVGWLSLGQSAALFEHPSGRSTTVQETLGGVVDACRSNSTVSPTSPILLAVRRGLEALNAQCVEAGVALRQCRRRLFLHSDLRESDTAWLAGRKGARQPEPLNSEGVEIIVCGISETSDRSTARRSNLKRWRHVLGEGAPLHFAPTCPVAEAAVTR